jgi:hypothetical protein
MSTSASGIPLQSRRRTQVILFFALLLTIDWFLYFRHAGHFFQADTIFLLDHRALSVRDYFKEFIALNPSGWYRPLANELIESMLYPVAGIHPIPYRIPVYAVFITLTAGVYALALALTRRHLAAALATFFFTVHTTNAYTTYDVGFMPELLYALFYVGATLAYLRYLEQKNKIAYALSLIGFVAGLLSKEAAVTLPAALFAAGILFGNAAHSFRERFLWTVRSIVPHLVILVVYLAFAVGYLNVMGFSVRRLFDRSQAPNPGDYIPVLNGGVFKNADLALTWVFNIPRAWWGQWQHLSAPMLLYLKFFRGLVFALMAVLVIRSERKAVLFGSAWFWITIAPALPLVSHFIPYYVFVPAIGLSVVVGAAFAWLYDVLSRMRTSIAAITIGLIFAGVLYVTSRSIRADVENSRLLGGSARLAWNTLSDVKSSYPVLPAGTTLYFLDEKEQLVWEHDFGSLIKNAYGTDKISVLYRSQGDWVDPDTRDVIIFSVRNGRLTDETANYRADPAIFMKFVASDLQLELSTADVTAGDKYTLTIKNVSDMPVRIAYTIDRGPLETFRAALDNHGKVTFQISPQTRKGMYKFVAFNVSGNNDWVRAERTLTVR